MLAKDLCIIFSRLPINMGEDQRRENHPFLTLLCFFFHSLYIIKISQRLEWSSSPWYLAQHSLKSCLPVGSLLHITWAKTSSETTSTVTSTGRQRRTQPMVACKALLWYIYVAINNARDVQKLRRPKYIKRIESDLCVSRFFHSESRCNNSPWSQWSRKELSAYYKQKYLHQPHRCVRCSPYATRLWVSPPTLYLFQKRLLISSTEPGLLFGLLASRTGPL